MVNWYVWGTVGFVSITGFFYGYDISSINGVKDMRGYRQALNLSYQLPSMLGGNSSDVESCDSQDDVDTSAILGLIISLLFIGGLVGSSVSGAFSDFVGRKPTIMLGACLMALGGILHTATVNLWMMILSRLSSGTGLGVLYSVTPLYVGEISPENLRGRLITLMNIYVTIAYLIGTVVNLIVNDYIFGWRISLSIQFVAGIILALGTFLLPRSPRWLVKKSREDEALKILTKVYRDEERAKSVLVEIKSVVTTTKEPFKETLKYICQWRIIQRLLLGCFLQLVGRFCGSNFILYFSVTIFCGIGLPGYAVTIPVGLTLVLAMVLSLTVIDKMGRKPLFLMGTFVMLISLSLSALLISAFKLEDIYAGPTSSQRVAGYVVVILVCLFSGANMVSCGNFWIIMSEIFPHRGRSFMVSICNIMFWVGLTISNQTGSILVSSPLHIYGTLVLFSCVIVIMFLGILLFLPETKGLTLEEVDQLFSKPWLKRTNVVYYLRCGCFWDLIVKRRSRVEQSEETQRLEISMDQISLSSSSSSSSDEDSTNLTPDKVHSELTSDL